MEAASEPDLSQRLPVKREPTKVPRERHGRNRRSFMAGRMSMRPGSTSQNRTLIG